MISTSQSGECGGRMGSGEVRGKSGRGDQQPGGWRWDEQDKKGIINSGVITEGGADICNPSGRRWDEAAVPWIRVAVGVVAVRAVRPIVGL